MQKDVQYFDMEVQVGSADIDNQLIEQIHQAAAEVRRMRDSLCSM